MPIASWRNVDPSSGPTGTPQQTFTLIIVYEVLDARAVSSISSFCETAVPTAAALTEYDEQQLIQGLEDIEAAAARLPPSKRDDLLTEAAKVRADIEEWFGPETGHNGFSMSGVVAIINLLCSSDVPALSVQA